MANQHFHTELRARDQKVEPLPKHLAHARSWRQFDLGILHAGWVKNDRATVDLAAAVLHFERGFATARTEKTKVYCACALAYLAHRAGDRNALEQQYSRLRLLEEHQGLKPRTFIGLLESQPPGRPSRALEQPPNWLRAGAR